MPCACVGCLRTGEQIIPPYVLFPGAGPFVLFFPISIGLNGRGAGSVLRRHFSPCLVCSYFNGTAPHARHVIPSTDLRHPCVHRKFQLRSQNRQKSRACWPWRWEAASVLGWRISSAAWQPRRREQCQLGFGLQRGSRLATSGPASWPWPPSDP